jgi:hypothetical protein
MRLKIKSDKGMGYSTIINFPIYAIRKHLMLTGKLCKKSGIETAKP